MLLCLAFSLLVLCTHEAYSASLPELEHVISAQTKMPTSDGLLKIYDDLFKEEFAEDKAQTTNRKPLDLHDLGFTGTSIDIEVIESPTATSVESTFDDGLIIQKNINNSPFEMSTSIDQLLQKSTGNYFLNENKKITPGYVDKTNVRLNNVSDFSSEIVKFLFDSIEALIETIIGVPKVNSTERFLESKNLPRNKQKRDVSNVGYETIVRQSSDGKVLLSYTTETTASKKAELEKKEVENSEKPLVTSSETADTSSSTVPALSTDISITSIVSSDSIDKKTDSEHQSPRVDDSKNSLNPDTLPLLYKDLVEFNGTMQAKEALDINKRTHSQELNDISEDDSNSGSNHQSQLTEEEVIDHSFWIENVFAIGGTVLIIVVLVSAGGVAAYKSSRRQVGHPLPHSANQPSNPSHFSMV